MELESLFPTPVAFFKLARSIDASEMYFVQGLSQRKNMGNSSSNNRSVLHDPAMQGLKHWIEASLEEYFLAIYRPKHSVDLRITQSWCNYTQAGEYHHKHKHPNSLVSGVFYVQADKDTDRITFYRDWYQQIMIQPSDFNAFNSESWWLPVGTGDLVLFPSGLSHMVEEVVGDHARISIAFNSFPFGVIGEDTDLSELRLEQAQ